MGNLAGQLIDCAMALMAGRLRLDDLAVFEAVASTLNFGAAARQLDLSQSAVSQAVARLEGRLGIRLFRRTTRRVSLTADGSALRSYAAAMSKIADDTRRHFASGARRTVRVGMVEDFALAGLHRLLALLMQEEPSIAITFRTGLSTYLRRLLTEGEVDLVLTKRVPGSTNGQLLFSRALLWVGDCAIGGRDTNVPIVTYPAPSETRDTIVDALRSAGRLWAVVAESDGITGLSAALQAKLGVGAFAEGLLPAGVGAEENQ